MATILKNPDRIKQIISRFYTGTCTVDVKESITNPETFVTRPEVRTVYEEIPCRLSHESKSPTESYSRNTTDQTVMLFLDNNYSIPSGARINVTQDGVSNLYAAASEPNVFETHQQIELILWENYSGARY